MTGSLFSFTQHRGSVSVQHKGPAPGGTIDTSELIVPFSTDGWPGFLFLREATNLRAVSKYDPRAAQAWRDALKEM